MFKKLNKKGFTLAELLIVVAIIAVLVAISIPIFTGQLAKARASTDAANIRAGYAEVVAQILEDNTAADGTKYYLQADGTVSTTKGTAYYKCKGAATNLAEADTYVGGSKASTIAWAKDDAITYTYSSTNDTVTVGKE